MIIGSKEHLKEKYNEVNRRININAYVFIILLVAGILGGTLFENYWDSFFDKFGYIYYMILAYNVGAIVAKTNIMNWLKNIIENLNLTQNN